ncbi:putative fluoride ion transporter CrcB [Dyadobacter beijingensis]|uniref:Fluoride-specific ion channel FluC n=1 Tax=Dyadobacter beijingensis TaxID=365489 RepID=A0ABQ2HBI8_9BACT|nr:fluoride efflux transporter CrcB [Dyadobacter beijingensis]GGM72607.1 putative fluoride ion transporter CrcB [Dyadobacter beijingensis]
MNNLIIVFVGGGLGSLARYGIGKVFSQWPSVFPFGTLTANILACLILGVFGGWATFKSTDLVAASRLFVVVGFCGGFSTFSSFSNETIQLFLHDHWFEAGTNILVSIIACFAATFLGIWLGKTFLAI